MSKKRDIQHSILIVSDSEQYAALVKNTLPAGRFLSIEVRKNGSLARRSILEKDYDMVVLNTPLPDENGIDFAMDITSEKHTGVLILTPREIYDAVVDHVTDRGILVLPKPADRKEIENSIRLLTAIQDRIRNVRFEVEKLQDKMDEMRLINKAKFFLVEEKHMTEDEAHRYIGKYAMDHGISRYRAALDILDDF